MDQPNRSTVHVDLIRTIAIIAVLTLHASGSWIISAQQMNQMTQTESITWAFVDVYQSFARIGVPLFLMLTGVLLLQPTKAESLSIFFKKRLTRIGLPFLFWGLIYFVWDFLVIGIPFSSRAIIQGILNGPYTQFWYLYLLVGLYLLTPILRIFVAHMRQNMIKYLAIIWLSGVSLIPVFGSSGTLTLNSSVFVVAGIAGSLGLGAYFFRIHIADRKMILYISSLWFLGVTVAPIFSSTTSFTLSTNVLSVVGFAGFLFLGTYLPSIQIRRSTILYFIIIGLATTAIGTYILASTVGGSGMYFFQQYFSPTVILTSVMVFLMLLTVRSASFVNQNGTSKFNKVLKLISQNTLAIFLLHVIVMEALQNGYLGFALNRGILNPILEIPLITVMTLFISLGLIVLLKKVPYLKKFVG